MWRRVRTIYDGNAVIYDDDDILCVAQTLLGEARGEGVEGMRVVAHVILNRTLDQRWPRTPAKVCKQPWQFSCWSDVDWNSSNKETMLGLTWKNQRFREAYGLAAYVLAGLDTDLTNGANHYHHYGMKPTWADPTKTTARLGRHVFYRL